jgi:purine-binding chemotaxis protein CheW
MLSNLSSSGAMRSRTSSHSAAQVAKAEFLTFQLGKEEYGIDILRVQEIRSYETPTRLAHAPDFIKGVVDLRGVIVPIVDLRMKLGCPTVEYTAFTVVIILNVAETVLGVVVDSVADVVNLPLDAIRPTPQFQSLVDESFIKGIANVDERMLIVMDIEALLSSADMGLLKAAVA